MIPSLLVSDIRTALVEFLATTFSIADDDVRDELTRFLDDRDDGIFRGPYLRVRTPFRPVPPSWTSPLGWLPNGFVPYEHQAASFERLSSADGQTPSPTLVTTGTGSGKTECFLYPILDHCARRRAAGKAGIKALILYPMNALASDQAERIAGLIHDEAQLAGLRAGLYVGESGRHEAMGEDHLIDKREVLRSNPPDILLTNYKMLDFLLLRREDRNLWADNDPDTLQYLVLDEFHTYDGAQGTDVAMLLRRLGRTLGMNEPNSPLGSVALVATSATLGTGAEAIEELREFAGKVFGTDFPPESVVEETRQTVDEACADVNYLLPIPDIDDLNEAGDDIDAIAAAFCRIDDADGGQPDTADLTDPVALGDRLLQHPLTRAVLAAVGDQSRAWPEALAEINLRAPNWGRAALTRPHDVERALGRFLWLLSLARRDQAGQERPLFLVEVQLWVREVSRLLRSVSEQPAFRWVDSAAPEADPDVEPDLPSTAALIAELPAIYCRHCGRAGWRAVESEVGRTLLTRITTIYEQSVRRSPTVRDLIATRPDDPDASWYDPLGRTVGDDTGDDAVPVLITANEGDAKAQRCPSCGESDGIRFLGLQVASLASVAVNTLFGSPHVEFDERKLLAFTDSVQDASHRASFFAGRTHRFNLRTRMAEIIIGRGDVALDDLGDELFNNADNPYARYAVVPPDLLRDPEVKTVWTDHPDEVGVEILRRRLGFEVDVEFGLRSRVGRTLELSRAVAAAVDFPGFDDVADLVAENLRRLDGDIDPERLANSDWYVRGLLERLRLRGGIINPLLEPYLEEGGRLWLIWGGRPLGLPPFTPGQGRPTFMTSSTRGDFDSLSAVGTTPTWAVDWARRCFGVEPAVARDLNLDTLALLTSQTAGVVEVEAPGGRVWGLSRRAVRVWGVVDGEDEPTAAGVRCRLCGHRHPVPPHLVDQWHGAPCLRYRCTGTYETDPPRATNYYRNLYRGGATRRVVTGEHTGVLRRQAREDLERAFKSGTAPDAPNVITATPTLEMGIDIGDLSTVMLTSVPRNPASYVQRVGRAGRLSGNSLVTTFVRTDTHGLYYLSNPEAMISGDVRPPNCYLDAVETLQRQYVAFLIDRIADLSLDGEPLPTQIGQLMRTGLDDGAPLRRIVDASNLDPGLVDDFLDLFGDRLSAVTGDVLREFARAGIETTVKEAIETWRAEEHELDLRRRRLTDAIDGLVGIEQRTPEQDDELAGFTGQRAALLALLRDHRDEYALSALERVGLLPNYTLLGDTSTLRATLWSKSGDGEVTTESLEYQRPAELALREFAPGNTFYANGHKHVIDTLEIGSGDQPLFEKWRLCPDCGYAEIEREGEAPTVCPRCRELGIADTGASYTMVRLRTAMSASSEENARVYDESDERQRERYELASAIDADPAHITDAWAIDEKAFGAELSGRTRLRTINLGFAERRGEQRSIAGFPRHVTYFTVCRFCGAVRDVRDHRDGTRTDRLHLGWCKVRSGAKKEQWDPVLLLHELVTEAVRLLLPVSMFEVEERLASFKGALLLGLREDFGGDPDHLRVARTQMPNRDGQGHRQFLVLYDEVPGGTGYLARLADPERMRRILEAGRQVISRCPCRAEGRRACHRCLLGVVDRSEYDLVARDLALDILDDLLDDWRPEPRDSVASLAIGRVEESELERRFKVAVRSWAEHPDNDAVTFRTAPGSGGREAFELLFRSGDDTIRYRIVEQEGLGTTPSTIPDFVIHRQDAPGPEVAVYLDGYQFHASASINNLADDAAKRAGVRSAGKLVWNLTWRDVEEFHKAADDESLGEAPRQQLLSTAAQGVAATIHHRQGGSIDFPVVNENPLDLLMNYLANPDLDEWERLALSAVGGIATEAGLDHPLDRVDLEPAARGAVDGRPDWPTPGAAVVATGGQWATENGLPITVFISMDDPNAERWTVISSIPSRTVDVESPQHRDRWLDWMQWANVLQFLRGYGRNVVISATTQADSIDLDHLWMLDGTAPAESSAAGSDGERDRIALTDDQQDELELVDDDDVRDLVRSALELGAPEFVAGYEIDGRPVEAVWPDQRVGVSIDADENSHSDYDIRPVGSWTLDDLLVALERGA